MDLAGLLLALSLAQAGAPPAEPPRDAPAAPPEETPAPAPPAPPATMPAVPAVPEGAKAIEGAPVEQVPASKPKPARRSPATSPSDSTATPGPDTAPAASPQPAPRLPPAATPAATPGPDPKPAPKPGPTPAPGPTASPPNPTATPAPAPAPAARPRPEALALAERFLGALGQRRAEELAALCRPGFSFDGRVASSAEEVQRRWGEILAARAGPHEKVEGIEILQPAEAVARLGKPPRRLEPALAGASAVALARVGGRQVALFLVRQGAGWSASGMSD